MENLSHNANLQHIDLSDNSVYSLGDVHGLTKLTVPYNTHTGGKRRGGDIHSLTKLTVP